LADLDISGFSPATVLWAAEFADTLGKGSRGLCWCSETWETALPG